MLTSPSKTFNVASVAPALAVVPGAALFDAFSRADFTEQSMSPFAYAAVAGAWGDSASEQWRRRLVAYLRSNRDHAVATLLALPGVRLAVPEAGCLLWLDLSDAGIPAGVRCSASLRRQGWFRDCVAPHALS